MDLADACLTPPAPGHGRWVAPDVRLVVELLTPMPVTGVLWDVALWDDGVWGGEVVWSDVTCDCVDVDVASGRPSPLDRYRTAVSTIALADPAGFLHPKATTGPHVVDGRSLIRAGLVARVGAVVDGTWWAWHTGATERVARGWAPNDVAVTVLTVVDPLADLATIDGLEQPPTGAGDTVTARLARLLDRSGWRWPRRLADDPVTLQATTLAQNRLGECYLAADSAGGTFYADGDGAARYDPHTWRPGGPVAVVAGCDVAGAVPWSELVPAWDTDRVVNIAAYARAGGTVVTVQDTGSVAQHGPFVDRRLDLICASDADVARLAGDVVARHAWDTDRIDQVTFDADTSLDLPAVLGRLALRDVVEVHAPVPDTGVVEVRWCTVEGLNRRVTSRGPDTPPAWTVTADLADTDPTPPTRAATVQEGPPWL